MPIDKWFLLLQIIYHNNFMVVAQKGKCSKSHAGILVLYTLKTTKNQKPICWLAQYSEEQEFLLDVYLYNLAIAHNMPQTHNKKPENIYISLGNNSLFQTITYIRLNLQLIIQTKSPNPPSVSQTNQKR